jgi:hypothetical protein
MERKLSGKKENILFVSVRSTAVDLANWNTALPHDQLPRELGGGGGRGGYGSRCLRFISIHLGPELLFKKYFFVKMMCRL